ncbi:MAG: hypothetical protein WC894_00975 [Patescibacteria group bacterium]
MFRENKTTKEIRFRLKNRWPIVGPDHTHRYFLEEYPRFTEGKEAYIYQANDTQTLKSVAVKILPKDRLPGNSKRLENEAYRLKKLSGQPGIPKFIDYFISQSKAHGESPTLVMEFINEESLNDKFDNNTLTKTEFIRAIIQTAEVLDILEFSFDLKPEHVKLTEPFITLVDFGENYTKKYSAPERIRGETNITTNSFALAALTKFLLTGIGISTIGIDPQTVKTKFDELTSWNLNYIFDESDIIRMNNIFKKALSNIIEERYKSASDFAREFAEVMKNAKGPNNSFGHKLHNIAQRVLDP